MLRSVRRLSCGSVAAWGWSIALAWMVASSAPASAQTDVLNELYGSGVHAYNAGQYRDAYDDFTMAVQSGSKDPRVFYYRGLAYLRLGRPQEAQSDFKKAASLEMADTDHFYPVSKSLERIQGPARSQIERYRSKARLVAYQTRERQRFERFERIRKNEPNVLLTPDEAAEMPTPAKEPEPAEAAEPEMPNEKPEATDEKEPAEDMPAEKSDDPFAAAADDEKKPDDEAAEKDEEMPADEEKADDGKKKDADDPFAE
jgi:tetratricopeptide (TPR) repeat protein